MPIELACACGKVQRWEQPPPGGFAVCPVCGARLEVPAGTSEAAGAAAARKPLWTVMGRPADEPIPPRFPAAPENAAAASAPAAAAAAAPVPDTAATADPAASAPRPARKGLWSVMQTAPATTGAPTAPIATAAPPTSSPPVGPAAEPAVGSPAPGVPPDEPHTDAALAELFRETTAAPFTTAAAQRRGGESRHAVWSLLLGLTSLPLALLALIPNVWARLPAPLVGFLAIITGLIALQEIRQSGGRQRARHFALSGIVAGIIGSFLPPIVLSAVGRWLVQNSQTGATLAHLETIGTALGAYEKQHGAYPPGGVFKPTKSGDQRGYHGWLTLLLPWLDQADLYAAVRQDVPYDEPANLPVFEQDIPEFFAAGTDRSKVRGKFGVTHFAGVGGDITDESGAERRVLHSGLFGMNSSVQREQITDGLSHTLAAGEIADDLPPWGDPENWRPVGRGLNRDRQGFGNHARTGGCFLMADGSVRFLSNRTAPEILTALSTRDGGESQP